MAVRDSIIGPGKRKVVTWEDIDWVLSISKRPVLLKGILTPEDANEAVHRGAHGIHGEVGDLYAYAGRRPVDHREQRRQKIEL